MACGKKIKIESSILGTETQGVLTYVSPFEGELTRSDIMRIVIPGQDGIWHLGLFVNIQDLY